MLRSASRGAFASDGARLGEGRVRVAVETSSATATRNIPEGAHRIMAERASAKHIVEIAGASHVVGVSPPPRRPT
jgi:hypothetical protein